MMAPRPHVQTASSGPDKYLFMKREDISVLDPSPEILAL